ncbi:TPA: hypothetical protein ACH3X1_005358 [Trebouxia sp. C0004]
MVLAHNQQPRPECVRCSQPSEVAYFKYYPNNGGHHLEGVDEHSHLIADSDAEAESADGEEGVDENDEDYWLREDADEQAHKSSGS